MPKSRSVNTKNPLRCLKLPEEASQKPIGELSLR
jgi:hypothetical protein